MSRNTSIPNVKTMDENWKITFGEVIQERKSKLSRWRIISVVGLCLIGLSYTGMTIGIQLHNIPLAVISLIAFFVVLVCVVVGSVYTKRRRFLYGMDVLYYNLYELACLFEKYQKPDETLPVKEGYLKQINKLLKESSTSVSNFEDNANRYVYPDDEKTSLIYFKKNFYYFKYIIQNKKFPIPDSILKTIVDNCDAHMKLRIRNHTDYNTLHNIVLETWKTLSIPEYTEAKENKWLKFFINRTLLEKVIMYSVINTAIVGAFFYFIMPGISGFAKDTIFLGGIAVWGVFEAAIFVVLWSYRGISGT